MVYTKRSRTTEENKFKQTKIYCVANCQLIFVPREKHLIVVTVEQSGCGWWFREMDLLSSDYTSANWGSGVGLPISMYLFRGTKWLGGKFVLNATVYFA